jgi:hypothetical protein
MERREVVLAVALWVWALAASVAPVLAFLVL